MESGVRLQEELLLLPLYPLNTQNTTPISPVGASVKRAMGRAAARTGKSDMLSARE
jgi:hypothetical protein